MDIAGRMLNAVVGGDSAEPDEQLSLAEMKEFAVEKINDLAPDDRREVGAILVMNGRGGDIKYCAQGSMIDLDRLPERIVRQMYSMIRYKLDNKKSADI